jgi:subtilisin family serine protease
MKKKLIVGALVASLTFAAVPAYAAVSSWGIDRLDGAIDGSYSVPYTGTGVTAYVLDTGVALSDPGFGGRASGDVDCNGHGTHVAGIIGSSQYGVATGVKIVSIKVADCSGTVYSKDLIAGIDKVLAMNKGPAVVNISIALGKSATVDAAIDRLYNAGILPVVAASNTNSDACQWSPSGALNAFTVGGTNMNDQRTNTSAFGDCVDIFAPGGLITSEDWQNPTASKVMTGTSMAAPHVVGVAALYLQKNPTAKPIEVANALRAGAEAGAVIDAKSANGNYLLSTKFLNTPYSAPVASPIVSEVPGKVFNLAAVSGVAIGTYKLSWSAPTNFLKAGIIGYKIESSSTGSVWSLIKTTTTPDVSTMISIAGYYRVTAIGSLGIGPASLTLRVTAK